MLTRSFIVFAAFLFFSTTLLAERPEFGSITREELTMTSHPVDPDAASVILYDYGMTDFDFDFDTRFLHHRRIKIFSRGGFDDGEYSFTIRSGKGVTRLLSLKGMTHYLDDRTGKIVSVNLDEKDIYKEEVNETVTRYRFTLPSLRVGCVVEFMYQVVDRGQAVRSWNFQTGIPIAFSEYRFKYPNICVYNTVVRGYFQPQSVGTEKTQIRVNFGNLGPNVDANESFWIFKDIPALKNESFVIHPRDYQARVEIELYSVTYPGKPPEMFFSSWGQLLDNLSKSLSFGQQLKPRNFFDNAAKVIALKATSEEEKIKAAYEFITTEFKWNGYYSYLFTDPYEKIIADREGDSADLTLGLYLLLKSLGVKVDLVFISTRNHGIVNELKPGLNQFNHILVTTIVNSKRLFLDATNPMRPYFLLGSNSLSFRGLLYSTEVEEWLDISPSGSYKVLCNITAKVKKSGDIEFSFENEYLDYAALSVRNDLKNNASLLSLVRRNFSEDLFYEPMDSITIENRDNIYEPLVIKGTFRVQELSKGEMIYFNPSLFRHYRNNPFNSPERAYPVDMQHPYDFLINLNFEIEDGIIIQDTLKSLSVRLPDNSALFTRTVSLQDKRLLISSRFQLRKERYMPDAYPMLRNIYSRYINAESEHLVFKRIENESPLRSTPADKKAPPTSSQKGKKSST